MLFQEDGGQADEHRQHHQRHLPAALRAQRPGPGTGQSYIDRHKHVDGGTDIGGRIGLAQQDDQLAEEIVADDGPAQELPIREEGVDGQTDGQADDGHPAQVEKALRLPLVKVPEHTGHQREPSHVRDQEGRAEGDVGIQIAGNPELGPHILLQQRKADHIKDEIGNGHCQHTAACPLVVPILLHIWRPSFLSILYMSGLLW